MLKVTGVEGYGVDIAAVMGNFAIIYRRWFKGGLRGAFLEASVRLCCSAIIMLCCMEIVIIMGYRLRSKRVGLSVCCTLRMLILHL